MINKYPKKIVCIHWITAALIISALIIGFILEDLQSNIRMQSMNLHKSFGIMVFILLFIRIIFRLVSKIPPMPEQIKRIEQIAAGIGHFSFYVLMAIVPLSGLLMVWAKGYNAGLFGLKLPVLLSASPNLAEIFSEVHEISAAFLLLSLFGHISAVIKHYVIDKVNLMPRIL